MSYLFRSASQPDVYPVFQLYEDRVCWMARRNLRQWDATDYLAVYPPEYFGEQASRENLYILENVSTRRIVAAVVLLQADPRWLDYPSESAYYIHNLVTDVHEKGLGGLVLQRIESLARAEGKRLLRLDCAVDNAFLNTYYESLGYLADGQFQEGPYAGLRREKRLY